MSHPLLNPGEPTRRPFNPVPWVLTGVLAVALAGVLWFALASRKKSAEPVEPEAIPEDVAPEPTPPAPPAPTPTRRVEPVPPPPAPKPTPAPAAVAVAPTPAPAPAPAAPPAGNDDLIGKAQALKGEDKYQEARELARQALRSPDAGVRSRAEQLLGELHIGLLFSQRAMPEKVDYTVAAGDSLDKIARKFGTTIELVKKSNNLEKNQIRAGSRFRIFSGTFTAKVDKSDNTLLLLLNGEFFKRYRVGTGQYNRTPVGSFQITDRIAQPTWWKPDGKAVPYGDPENLLGTHWLAINVPGYGIHGTWEPETIGKQSSMGCIRLVNDDVAELFTLLPVGTAVTIED